MSIINKSNSVLVGLGGAGGSITDKIISTEPLFDGFFINTSSNDMEVLENYNKELGNGLILGTSNGSGTDRNIGKMITHNKGYIVLDRLINLPQDHIWFISSLSGGSGSAILTTVLGAIKELKQDGDFDKTIHVISVLPKIKSPKIILENCKESWNELLQYSDVIASMIFIDNDSKIANNYSILEGEKVINNNFAEQFISIFDMATSPQFDNADLSNILNDGVLYFYELDETCSSIDIMLQKASTFTTLSKMFKNEMNTDFNSDGEIKTKCGYIGLSLADNSININNILNKFLPSKEVYMGENEYEKNILLISGCLPPFEKIQLINKELEDINKNNINNGIDFSQFVIPSTVKEEKFKEFNPNNHNEDKPKKRKLKKNLFKR